MGMKRQGQAFTFTHVSYELSPGKWYPTYLRGKFPTLYRHGGEPVWFSSKASSDKFLATLGEKSR